MISEQKKRFYPKRRDYVIEHSPVPFVSAPKGRQPIDDSKLVSEAINGIDEGIYRNANHAALKISLRIGGKYIDRNQKRLFRKIRNHIRKHRSRIIIEEI
jgi:hypothetical protein